MFDKKTKEKILKEIRSSKLPHREEVQTSLGSERQSPQVLAITQRQQYNI